MKARNYGSGETGSWGPLCKRAAQVFCCLLGVLLLSLPAFSQGSTGRILGTVTDTSGGVVAGAMVSVVDTERGVTRTLTTDDAGVYNAPNLTPGTYTVRAEAKGFKKLERQNVVVEVGREIRIDLTVQPGEQNQTVTVTESVPLVETTNATMGGTLENADIADLPLNGRDYQNLLGLRPGVMLQPGGGPWTQSTNGVRPDESVWMVDGVYNENFFDGRSVIGMSSPLTDAASILPIDAIQEFNVMENPKAEYGWKPGAVVNVGIKSGTNQLHGSAYAFGRDGAWDARNYFNIAPQGNSCALGLAPPPLAPLANCAQLSTALKQFGGVVGGPIKKDKLFFFAGYEGLRSFISANYVSQVPDTGPAPGPSATPTANNMLAAIAALQAAGLSTCTAANTTNCISPVSLALAGCTPVAAPTACTGGAGWPTAIGTNNFISSTALTNRTDNGIGKLDWHPNDKNAIAGMFYQTHYNAGGEDHGFLKQGFADQIPIRVISTTSSWVYTPNSSMVNDMRFGYDRTTFDFVNNDINVISNGVGYPVNTGVTATGGLANIAVGSFFPTGTAANRPQYYSPNPYFDFQDSVSVLKGKHSFKFGGEFTHIEADSAVFNNSRGTINFAGGGCPAIAGGLSTGLEDFFCGTPSGSPAASQLTGNPTLKFTWMNTAGYIQDDWRVTQKVIINLGLRYEYSSPIKDFNDGIGNFDPILGMVQQGHGTDSVFNGDHRNFSPRIGFAWDVTGKGTTVIRGGSSLIREGFNLDTWIGQFGLQNDGATSLNAVPTGAILQVGNCQSTNSCRTSGGTDFVSAASYSPSALCWNAPPVGFGCPNGQGTVFPTPACGDGLTFAGITNASPCDIMGGLPNLRTPFVLSYNGSITHAFGSDLSVEVGYVGNHGYRLLNFADINQAPLGAAYCLNTAPAGQPSTITPAQAAGACSGVNPSVGLGVGKASALALQEGRPFYTKFPYLGFINYATNQSYSNYNGLQVSVTKRMSHGLSFVAGYTFSHAFDNGSLNRFGELPQNSNNTRAEYAVSDFDVRHRVTFTATYDIPGIKGFGQLLEGWELNTIVNFATPQPWTSWDPHDNFSGTGENADRWNITGPGSNITSGKNSIPYCSGFPKTGGTTGASCTVTSIYGGTLFSGTAAAVQSCAADAVSALTLAQAGCYVSTNGQTVLTPPAFGTYGNMGRNLFTDYGFNEWDMSVFKNFKFKERYGAQFRVEVFNVLNHATIANPYQSSDFFNTGNILGAGGVMGFSGSTADFAAGNPIIGSGGDRDIQLGLKLTF